MRKVLLALLVAVFAAGGAMAVTVAPGSDPSISIWLTSADPKLIYNGGNTDTVLETQAIMDSEEERNFLFDMGNISADRSSRATGKLTLGGGLRTNPALGTSVKHTVSVYGPGILNLAGNGYWQGTTTVAYNYRQDPSNLSDLTSGDGYLQLGIDNALPTWNPVTINIPGSDDVNFRSVLDLNGYNQRIRDLENAFDVTDERRADGTKLEGVIYLEGYRADKKKLPPVGTSTAWIQGTAGTLELQSSRSGKAAGDLPNDLGRLHGYGEVRLYNTLNANAPTVYDITSKEPYTGPRLINAEDTVGVSKDVMGDGLGLVGFHFGDGTTIGSQVTLKVNDASNDLKLNVRARYLSGGTATGSTLDLFDMQYETTMTAPSSVDHFIVDTDGDFTYLGKFIYPETNATPPNLYNSLGAWEPNFIKTGWGVQTVTDRALEAGAVFKVDEVRDLITDAYYGAVLPGRVLVSKVYPDGELKFLMTKDVDFSTMTANKADRPVFLSGAGTYGFDSELDRTANVGMLMDYDAARPQWPYSAGAVVPNTVLFNYNNLLPFDNTNVHVYAGTLKNAIFGYTASTASVPSLTQFDVAGPVVGDNLATYELNYLNPELQLIAPTHHGVANKGFQFLEIHKDAGNLTVDENATVILTPWSWSALGTLAGSGTVVMDSPRTMAGTGVSSTTFLRLERSATLDATFADQFHRAYLWLGVNKGEGAWTTRYFVLGDNFDSNVDRIIVTRGAALTIAGFNKPELTSSVAFYGTRVSTEEPATYRVNVQSGGESSTLAVKDGNSFYFADPEDLRNGTEGSVKLEFAGSAKKDDIFTILRGQNASEGQYRFVYDTVNWELYSLPEELGRNLYARALNDMLAPEVLGLGQAGRFEWTLDEVNKNKITLGIVTDPSTGILRYRYEGDDLPDGVQFNGIVNGVESNIPGLASGFFRFTNELTKEFSGTIAAENIYGWSAAKSIKFVVESVTPPTPVVPVDENMATANPDNVTEAKSGDTVSLLFTIDPTVYDLDTLKLIASNAGWKIEDLDLTTGTFKVTGTMGDSTVTYYFTAERVDNGEEYKSATYKVTATETPTPGGGGSGGGCDAGFAGLALLLAAPLFLRKRP